MKKIFVSILLLVVVATAMASWRHVDDKPPCVDDTACMEYFEE